MPACPGTSPEPLPAGSALRLAASDSEAVPSSRADPDQLLGEVPRPMTLLYQLSFGSGVQYTGWDATVYVNEEVTHRQVNPGRSAVIAVFFLIAIFTVTTVSLQGVVSPAKLQANSSSALVYVAQALGGPEWAKVMALALALLVIATTGVSIVILARIMYGMASHRLLPSVLGNISPRFKTPAAGSILTGLTLIVIVWAYLLSSSMASAFTQLIDVTGILTAGFYILTALAPTAYYQRRVLSYAWDALLAGILPLSAARFLGWIIVRSIQAAPWPQRWSLADIIAVGVILMLIALFALRSPFFQTPRESA
jgi:amino acid transporter